MTDTVLAARPDLGGTTGLPAHARIAAWLEQREAGDLSQRTVAATAARRAATEARRVRAAA